MIEQNPATNTTILRKQQKSFFQCPVTNEHHIEQWLFHDDQIPSLFDNQVHRAPDTPGLTLQRIIGLFMVFFPRSPLGFHWFLEMLWLFFSKAPKNPSKNVSIGLKNVAKSKAVSKTFQPQLLDSPRHFSFALMLCFFVNHNT